MFVATTDSYLKWAVGLNNLIPQSWRTSLVLVKSLQNPSVRQIELAVNDPNSDSIVREHIFATVRRVMHTKPDIILVAATGPFLVLFRWLLDLTPEGRRVKLVSGSPGIAYHLVGAPLRARTSADLLLMASKAELERISGALKDMAVTTKLALASLPFLDASAAKQKHEGPEVLIFAPQPDMPKTLEDRQKVLIELSRLRKEFPALRIIVKLRAIEGESQTHFEAHPYPLLSEQLAELGLISAGDFEFEVGTISEFLKNSNATLVTVSSTAALESLAMGNPTQIISDFGVEDALANAVFEDSGLVWSIRDYGLARLQKPNQAWLEKNYFHKKSEDNWVQALAQLTESKRVSPKRIFPTNIGKSLLFGELLRVIFPNSLGIALIKYLKLILGKNPS
jgi:hypothetical protein